MTIDGKGVGETHEMGAFGLGVAPRSSKPVNKIELSKEQEAEIFEAQRFEPYDLGEKNADAAEDEVVETGGVKKKTKKRPSMDKQTAFLEFKKEDQA
jgi:hypothetical protein